MNFLGTFGGLALLFRYGRKSIMQWVNALISLLLIGVGIVSMLQNKYNVDNNVSKEDRSTNPYNYPAVILVLSFVVAFELSSGPITWLYMAEIMQDKAVSIATVMNWVISLIVAIITPIITNDESIGYIFLVMGGFTVLGTLFIIFFMKETKGKSAQEIEDMFTSEKKGYAKIED